MFSDELQKYDWDETTAAIMSKTAADVERALAARRPGIDDFMALVSPAAAPYLEAMAHRSRELTRRRFGKTMSMYVPLYITNSCTNSCVYCGFNRHNKMARVVLTPEEIEKAVAAIIQETGATSMKEMGKVMGIASRQLAGKADGKAVADTVKRLLS